MDRPKVNLSGRLTRAKPRQYSEHAQLFLGPHFKPMHLVPSVGIPCVIAFSAAVRPCIWYLARQQQQIVYHQTSCHGCKLGTSTVEACRYLTSITVAVMA